MSALPLKADIGWARLDAH